MLRNRIKRRGRKAAPIDVVRGVVVETLCFWEVFHASQISEREYRTDVDNERWDTYPLTRYDDDRQAWEHHWRIRREVRRQLQRDNGPRPLRARTR